MEYKLVITETSKALLRKLVTYLSKELKSEQAATHLLNEVEKINNRLKDNPFQFPLCKDAFLQSKGYHLAVVAKMNYTIIFRVEKNTVFILGFFHTRENYEEKIEEI